jgi:hypothetical protein
VAGTSHCRKRFSIIIRMIFSCRENQVTYVRFKKTLMPPQRASATKVPGRSRQRLLPHHSRSEKPVVSLFRLDAISVWSKFRRPPGRLQSSAVARRPSPGPKNRRLPSLCPTN